LTTHIYILDDGKESTSAAEGFSMDEHNLELARLSAASQCDISVIKEEGASTVHHYPDFLQPSMISTKRPWSPSSLSSASEDSESFVAASLAPQFPPPCETSRPNNKRIKSDSSLSLDPQIVEIQKEILQTLKEIRDAQRQRLALDIEKLEFMKTQAHAPDSYLKV